MTTLPNKKYYAGIDLGGTFIKAGIVDQEGNLLIKGSVPTGKERPAQEIVADMAELVKSLCKEAEIDLQSLVGAGVGAPGSIDSEHGVIVYSNNIPWEDVPLAELLGDALGKPVKVTNDANAAALGEAKFGAGKSYHDSLFITLGTGVGGGIVIGDKLFEGNKSAGAEVGHMVIVEDGVQCTCGRKGCFEAYASATALIRDTKNSMRYHKDSMMWEIAKTLDDVNGKTVFDAAEMGDNFAKTVVNGYIRHLAEGIINLINILRPQAVILGGGVCAQGETLLNPLRNYVNAQMYGGNDYAPVELLIASLGNDAGLFGAAALTIADNG